MDFFAFVKIDNLKRVIAQRADEQSFVDGIEGKMINPTFDAGERDCLLKFERLRVCRGAAITPKQRQCVAN